MKTILKIGSILEDRHLKISLYRPVPFRRQSWLKRLRFCGIDVLWGRREKIFVCENCGYRGRVKIMHKGSDLTEIFFWLFLLPGLVYSLWRTVMRYKGCPVCGSCDVVPADKK